MRIQTHSATEMATFETHIEKIQIKVYGNEGPVPHFHFKSPTLDGSVCLDTPEYFNHGPDHFKSSTQRDAIINFLKSSNDKLPEYTNYQVIRFQWTACNPQYEIPVKAQMPDYSILSVERR